MACREWSFEGAFLWVKIDYSTRYCKITVILYHDTYNLIYNTLLMYRSEHYNVVVSKVNIMFQILLLQEGKRICQNRTGVTQNYNRNCSVINTRPLLKTGNTHSLILCCFKLVMKCLWKISCFWKKTFWKNSGERTRKRLNGRDNRNRKKLLFYFSLFRLLACNLLQI